MYDLVVEGVCLSLQKLANGKKYRSKPGVREKLAAICEGIRAGRDGWDFRPSLTRWRDIGKLLAQDFYREGGHNRNKELIDSQAPPLIANDIRSSSQIASGFTAPCPIGTLPDGIHLFFDERFGFSHYLSYPLLFFHEYASHVYVPRTRMDDKRFDDGWTGFDDGWLVYAIDLFVNTRWSELCGKYPLICAHGDVLRDIWRPRLTKAAADGYDIACDVDRWLGHADVRQPDKYSRYEAGLRRLLDQMEQDHPRYTEALTYEQRLTENIYECRLDGDTDRNTSDRSKIIRQLNSLALSVLHVPFNALCDSGLSYQPKFLQITWDLASYPADVAGTISFHGDFLNLVKQFTQSDKGPLLCSAAENSANALELYEKLKAMS
jgi:hypothetical protein